MARPVSPRTRFVGGVAVVVASLITWVSTLHGQQNPLFEEVAPPIGIAVADSAVERRFVRVNLAALGSRESRRSVPGRAETVMLDLLDRGRVIAVMDHVERLQSGRTVWVGTIAGEELTSAIFVADAETGIVTGSISGPNGVYRITPAASDVHVLSRLDPAGDRGDITLDPPPIDAVASDPNTTDDGSRIDVMVVYTPTARLAAGGTAAIESLIDLSIAETNQSYANSGVTPRLRLVRKQEVSYTESGDFVTDLIRLRNTSDGFIDNVHALRDQYGADMVSMVIEGTQYCGIAYTIGGPSTVHAPNAFQVTARVCATGYYTMAHEFGHLQGARHDWWVDPTNNSPYTYNHGYYPPSRSWRTIMAYADGCFGCPRIQWWSNPNLARNGEAMGVLEGLAQAADNRKALNNTAFYVANFRAEVGTPAAMTSPAQGSTLPGSTASFNWNSGSAVTSYWLEVGTGFVGAKNVYNASTGTNQSATVTGLPTDGAPVFARLWSLINGAWQWRDYTYTAAACTSTSMTSPSPGSSLSGSSILFSWSGSSCGTQFWLEVGTGSPGAKNIYGASTGTNTSVTVSALPNNGATVYVRLWTLAGAWTYVDYTYTASALACSATTMSSPAPGTTLTSTSLTFAWTGNACASQYWLEVGTGAAGAKNIYNSSTGLATSQAVAGLPRLGETVYVRLWTFIASWTYSDYTYTAVTAPRAQLTSPLDGSLLLGTSVNFAWGDVVGVSQYWLTVGTAQGAGNIFDGSTGSATTTTVGNVPIATCTSAPVLINPPNGSTLEGSSQTFSWSDPCSGPKVWVRLWSLSSAGWTYIDYAFETKGYKLSLGSIGSMPFGNDIFNSPQGLATSASASFLPTDGSTIFGCLWRLSGGAWACDGVAFRAAGTATGFGADFNAPGFVKGWDPLAGTWAIDGNGHYVSYGVPDSGSSVSYDTDYSSIDYTVVMKRDAAANGSANRLWVRGAPNPLAITNTWQNGYSFQYTSDGFFSVFKLVSGLSIPVQGWTTSSAIIQGPSFNTLRVMASGANLSFSINGTVVWSGTDQSFTIGRVGFGAFDTDWLRVDSVTLSTAVDNVPTVSDEQRQINEATRDGGGSVNQAPRRP